MGQWPLEWFECDLNQCWENLWFLWRSSRVRDQLVCRKKGVNPIPAGDANCEVWYGWK